MTTNSYSVMGFIWEGLNEEATLEPMTIKDDDDMLSPFLEDDSSEKIVIENSGVTYDDNVKGGTYELRFKDSGGEEHTEDFILFNADSTYIFITLPGSKFDNGSIPLELGGWAQWTEGVPWSDITCFESRTLINTSQGAREINSITPGDEIETTSGFSTVCWVGHRLVTSYDLSQNPKLRPVRIKAGALGIGLPSRDLIISPQHRILVKSKIAERMFMTREALISAIKLTELPGIFIDETVTSVEYFHLLLKHHEVIFAEGAESESLFTGPQALNSMSPEVREEITTIFPEIRELDYAPKPACFIPHNKLQKQLVSRHLKNNQALFCNDFK